MNHSWWSYNKDKDKTATHRRKARESRLFEGNRAIQFLTVKYLLCIAFSCFDICFIGECQKLSAFVRSCIHFFVPLIGLVSFLCT